MLPMDVAPRAGLLPELQKTKPVARASLLDVWDDAERLAVDFWQRVAQDPRISKGFREAASGRAR